jgi:hypothetical protein
MNFELVCFQIHFGVEHDQLLIQTFLIWTHKVFLAKVHCQRVVVNKVLLLTTFVTAITYVTSLVLHFAMRIEFVVAKEALPAEAALRMACESALVNCARVVIAEFLVLGQIGLCEQFVFMCKSLLVPSTQIATLY